MNAQALVGFGIEVKDTRTNGFVLCLSLRRRMSKPFVVSASVDSQYSAEGRDTVLSGKRFYGGQSLSECGVNIAMAFFNMRFSSSS